MAFSVVILDGCVVRRKFPWHAMLSRFSQVFNEIGGTDYVPYLAGLLSFSMPPMGTAGAKGFVGPAVTAQTLNPSEEWPVSHQESACCAQHGKCVTRTFVHNIRFPKIDHYKYHESLAHAKGFWLPRLLHMDPVLYRKFYEDCATANGAKGTAEYRIQVARIRKSCYGWTFGSLEGAVRSQILFIRGAVDSEDTINQLVNGSVAVLCGLTTEIVNRLQETPPPLEDKIWEFLDPRAALRNSVASMIEASTRADIIPT
jgi:hypothetical protein